MKQGYGTNSHKLRIQDITYYSNKRQHPFSYMRTPTTPTVPTLDNPTSLNDSTNYIYTPTHKHKSKTKNKYQDKNSKKVLHDYICQQLCEDQANQSLNKNQYDGLHHDHSSGTFNNNISNNKMTNYPNKQTPEKSKQFGKAITNNTNTNSNRKQKFDSTNVCNCSCQCIKHSKSKSTKKGNKGIMREAISARIQQYKREHKNKQLLKTHQTIQSHLQTLNQNSHGSQHSPLSHSPLSHSPLTHAPLGHHSQNCPTLNKTSQNLYRKLAERHNLSPKVLVRFEQYERSKTLKKLQMKIESYYKQKNRIPRAQEVVSPDKLGQMQNAKKLVSMFESTMGREGTNIKQSKVQIGGIRDRDRDIRDIRDMHREGSEINLSKQYRYAIKQQQPKPNRIKTVTDNFHLKTESIQHIEQKIRDRKQELQRKRIQLNNNKTKCIQISHHIDTQAQISENIENRDNRQNRKNRENREKRKNRENRENNEYEHGQERGEREGRGRQNIRVVKEIRIEEYEYEVNESQYKGQSDQEVQVDTF